MSVATTTISATSHHGATPSAIEDHREPSDEDARRTG